MTARFSNLQTHLGVPLEEVRHRDRQFDMELVKEEWKQEIEYVAFYQQALFVGGKREADQLLLHVFSMKSRIHVSRHSR